MKPDRSATLPALVVAATMLAGCTLGPDFRRPDAPVPGHYPALTQTTAGDEAAQQLLLGQQLDQAWWQLFRSADVNSVVTRALAQNHTIAAAAFTLAQAQELANARAGTLDPQVGVAAGIGREKYGDQFLGTSPKPPAFNYFAVGPTVSYAFDYAGGNARVIEQQRALAGYEQQQLNAAYLAVSGNAVMQSLRIASLRTQIATVQALLDQDRQNQQLVQQAFAAGAVSRIDEVDADSQLASDSAQLPPLRQELSLAEDALALVLGEAPSDDALPGIDLTRLTLPRQLPVSLPSELAHRRPDILAAEAQLHAATAAVGVASANLYPQISLSASFSQQATSPGQLFHSANDAWSLTGGLVAPLFDGGTLRAERRAAVDAMQASAASYQQTVLSAFGQVADALQALNHDAEALDAQSRARQAAQANLDLVQKSYQEGDTGLLQVIGAKRRLQLASLACVRISGQRYMDTAGLFLALGGAGPETGGNGAKSAP